MITKRALPAISAAVALLLVLVSCSSGPKTAEKGTPAFYWQAANETFAAKDYMKTYEHLDKLLRTQNEYTARAQAWQLVLTSGLAQAYMDMADQFEYGARANKSNPMPFRKQTSEYRAMAGRLALSFAETFEQFEKNNKDATVELVFPYPAGSAALAPALTKAGNGILPAQSEMDDAHKRAMERGVLLATCKAAGAPKDPAKTQELFKAGAVKTSREAFFTLMAGSLYDQSQLYVATKLDSPDRLKFFCTHALEALKGVPESKDVKELKAKIETSLKSKGKGKA